MSPRPFRAAGAVPLAFLVAALCVPASARAACDPPAIAGLSSSSAPAAGGTLLTLTGSNFLSGGAPPVAEVGFSPGIPTTALDGLLVVPVPPRSDGMSPGVRVVRADGVSSPVVPFGYSPPAVTGPASGDVARGGGTVITITGRDFTCAYPRVTFAAAGSAPAEATVLAADDARIVVSSPEWDAASASVLLHVAGASVAAGSVAAVGPSLDGTSPSSSPARGGVLITLTGSNFGGGALRVLVGDNDAPVVSMPGPDEIVARVPPLAGGSTGVSARVRVVSDLGAVSRARPLEYSGAAALDAVRPASCAVSGGTPLTIHGDNFRSGAVVRFGAGEAVPATVLSPFALVCESPPLAAGPVPVTVEQDGLASPPREVEALDPPSLASVSPSSGGAEGGAILTLSGQNFGAGDPFTEVKVEFEDAMGTRTNVGPVKWMAPEVLRCRVPAGTPGPVSVVVTVHGVSTTLPDGFTYGAPGALLAPTISSVIPAQASRAGGTLVTVTGSNFDRLRSGSATVRFGSAEVAPVLLTNTFLTCVQPAVPAGVLSRALVVEADGLASEPFAHATAPPSLAGITWPPNPCAGGVLITITGSNFGDQARARFDGAGGLELPAVQSSSTSLVVNSPPSPTGAPLPVEVVVDGQVSNAGLLEYEGPALTGISASSLPRRGGAVITLNGSNFGAVPGRVLVDDDPAVVTSWADGEAVVSSPQRRPGKTKPVRVRLERGDVGNHRSASLWTKWADVALDAASPVAARAGGGTLLTIHGANFGPDAAIAGEAPDPLPPATIVDRSETRMLVQLGAGTPGTKGFAVTVPGTGERLPAGVEYLAPPAIAAVSPAAGPVSGGTSITIFGANFGPAAGAVSRDVRFAGQECPLAIASVDAGMMVCVTPPGPATGAPLDLVVTIDGVAATLPGAFEYSDLAGAEPPRRAARALALSAGPSPFRGSLVLRYTLPAAGRWTLDLYDARGSRVRRFAGDAEAGEGAVRWDGRGTSGRNVEAGVYFAKLASGGAERRLRVVRIE